MSKKGYFHQFWSQNTGTILVLSALVSSIYLFFKPSFYLTQQFDFWLAAILAPFVIRRTQSVDSQRFAILSAICISLLFFFRSNALYYFAFGALLLFIIEKGIGKVNHLAVFILIISSALFRVIMNIWSFPIRLKLSEWAGKALNKIGFQIEVVGNIIILDGQEFAVDPACMGLNMTTTALLLTLLLLAYTERLQQRYWKFWSVVGALSIATLLAIFANFTRLLLLIIFKILPEHPLHEVLGLVSIIVYVLIPVYFLSNYLAIHFPKLSLPINYSLSISYFNKTNYFIIGLLAMGLVVSGWQFLTKELPSTTFFEQIDTTGFQKNVVKNEILELRNDSLLVYIKPPSPIYRSTHDPRICWQGSGYRFTNIKIEHWVSTAIYTATLTQDNDRLYTAWWFESGEQKTISEWEWRWKSLMNGRAFRLVNVSAESKQILQAEVKRRLAE